MSMNRRGQMDVSFNWIYVLVAGAVILLFFIGIVVKQKQVSEEHLAQDVIGVMQSIIHGASVSEKTKNVINLQGLSERSFRFSCADGLGTIALEGRTGQVDIPIIPLFSAQKISSTHMVAWSLPYKLPFKMMDFLMVTSPDVAFVVSGNAQEVDDFVKDTAQLNVTQVARFDEFVPGGGKEMEIRLVDFGSGQLMQGVPDVLQGLDDAAVSGVAFSQNKVTFVHKQGAVWKSSAPTSVVSVAGDKAMKYAAIFSGNQEMYSCNLQKVWKRLPLVIEMYGGEQIGSRIAGGKLQQLIEYYEHSYDQSPFVKAACLGYLKDNSENNMLRSLTMLYNSALRCQGEETSCQEVSTAAGDVEQLNRQLLRECKGLY